VAAAVSDVSLGSSVVRAGVKVVSMDLIAGAAQV
jgi:hypothetical protein